MKPTPATLLLAAALTCLPGLSVLGQTFSSGSTGAFGPLDITDHTTLDLPPDGVFHCTTITVASGVELRFNNNALRTPVTFLATGDVLIAGTILVDGSRGSAVAGGLAGPGGFDGGSPGSQGVEPGDGHGPGGGKAGANSADADGAGAGGFANRSASGSSQRHGGIYGNPLILPILGGSGGGGTRGTPGNGGGGGGGAILIASSTKITMAGNVFARGGSDLGFARNGGSGGAIRLVAPRVEGNGQLNVLGRAGNGNGGDGRIRVDAQDRSAMRMSFTPTVSTAIGSMMAVFPDPLPRLDVTEAAGTAVTVDSGPVNITLPFGSPAAQQIKVRAKDFAQVVPVRVTLVPDSGASVSYDAEIDNAAANPAEITVAVEFPVNVQTSVYVTTR